MRGQRSSCARTPRTAAVPRFPLPVSPRPRDAPSRRSSESRRDGGGAGRCGGAAGWAMGGESGVGRPPVRARTPLPCPALPSCGRPFAEPACWRGAARCGARCARHTAVASLLRPAQLSAGGPLGRHHRQLLLRRLRRLRLRRLRLRLRRLRLRRRSVGVRRLRRRRREGGGALQCAPLATRTRRRPQ